MSIFFFRCDSDHVVLMDTNTEEQRVNFVTNAVQTLSSELKIDLNLRSLYTAKDEAVHELLKIATLLYTSTQQRSTLAEVKNHFLSFCKLLWTEKTCASDAYGLESASS